jgi:hypothetical protein
MSSFGITGVDLAYARSTSYTFKACQICHVHFFCHFTHVTNVLCCDELNRITRVVANTKIVKFKLAEFESNIWHDQLVDVVSW